MEPPSRSQEPTNYKIYHFFSSLTSHPLFSITVTTSLLIFLYLPRPLLPFLISPSFLSSLLFLFSLFRFGSSNSAPSQANPKHDNKNSPSIVPERVSETHFTWNNSIFDHCCLDFGGPLEVIYEEYEGEEEEDDDGDDDDDDDDDDDEIESFHEHGEWLRNKMDDDDDDEIEEELIEISFEDEEDNLIEIDISRSWFQKTESNLKSVSESWDRELAESIRIG